MKGLAVLLPFLLLLSLACHPRGDEGPAPLTYALHGETMGTTYTVKVVHEGAEHAELDALGPVVQAVLDDINGKMSTYLPDSELSRFDRFEEEGPFPVSPETFEVFALARRVSEASQGAFDVTVRPAVDRWGFGPTERGAAPTPDELAALRDRVGYQLIELDPETSSLRKLEPAVSADLSAIAKGYAVDRVAETLEARGHGDFMVEVGGEIRTLGRNDRREPWQLAIERPDPERRAIHRIVPLSGAALATSGDYRNFYLEAGVRFSHTIDPRTLAPVHHRLVSASVVADRCAEADAWATALMVLGPEAALATAEREGLAVLLLVSTPEGLEEHRSPRFDEVAGYQE